MTRMANRRVTIQDTTPRRSTNRMSVARFAAGSHRPPSWCNDEALRLLEEGLMPSPRIHDSTVIALAKFYRQRRGHSSTIEYARLREKMPAVVSAVELYESTNGAAQATIEALVLADEDRHRIASRVGAREETIAFYESSFFDIRSRLQHHAFIMDRVIGLNGIWKNPRKTYATALKLAGYLGSVAAVDVLTVGAGGPERWLNIREMSTALADRARFLSQIDATFTSREFTPKAIGHLFKVLEENQEWLKGGQFAQSPKDKLERTITRMFQANPNQGFTVPSPSSPIKSVP